MGRDGERLQVIFITLDPERDTPQMLDAYVKAFDPSFEALHGTLEETAATAKEFGVFFEKDPERFDLYPLPHRDQLRFRLPRHFAPGAVRVPYR